jgi:hypothetical protein
MPHDNVNEAVPILRSLAELYQKADREGREELKVWADYALHWACRRLEVFLPAARVSKAAAAQAVRLKIGDIAGCDWYDQKSAMRDPKRKIFHYEHVYPVSQLRHDLEKLDPVTDEAVRHLIERVDIAWILKEECARLDKAKYRSERPEDPWQAFRDVGIEMDS